MPTLCVQKSLISLGFKIILFISSPCVLHVRLVWFFFYLITVIILLSFNYFSYSYDGVRNVCTKLRLLMGPLLNLKMLHELTKRRSGMILTKLKRITLRIICPTATWSTKYLTWTVLWTNPGQRGEKLATFQLVHHNSGIFLELFCDSKKREFFKIILV